MMKTTALDRVLTRRRLLGAATMVPVAVVLSGASCQITNGATILPAAATAIQALGQYLAQNVLPGLQAAGTSVPSSIGTIIADIVSAAGTISVTSTASQGASTLATIENYFNALAPIALPYLSAIPSIGPFIGIAAAALPEIEGLINFGVTLLTPLVQQLVATSTTKVTAGRLGASGALTPHQALFIITVDTRR